MTVLREGEQKFHYFDGSHRWAAPTQEQQEAWTDMLKAHMSAHQEAFGGRYLLPHPPRNGRV
jgi:hypothetical protein